MEIINDKIRFLEDRINYLTKVQRLEKSKPHREREYYRLSFIYQELKVYEFSLHLLQEIQEFYEKK